MIDFLVGAGYTIYKTMTSAYTLITSKISQILPEWATAIIKNVPVVDLVLDYTILDLMLGAGLAFVIVYSLCKWLLP